MAGLLASGSCGRPSPDGGGTADTPNVDSMHRPAPGPPEPPGATVGGGERDAVLASAREVVAAFARRDGRALAALVHPARGVRFSPYAFVHRETDAVIPRDSVATLFSDTTRRVWGVADGSGHPIEASFREYVARFVYDVPFADAPVRTYMAPPSRPGNTPSNLAEVYPTGRWVELHFPGFEQKYEGMDWRSLWLVFERAGSRWLLVGVVHGSWTI